MPINISAIRHSILFVLIIFSPQADIILEGDIVPVGFPLGERFGFVPHFSKKMPRFLGKFHLNQYMYIKNNYKKKSCSSLF